MTPREVEVGRSRTGKACRPAQKDLVPVRLTDCPDRARFLGRWRMTPFDQDDKDGALPTRTDGWPSVSGRGVGHMGGCWRRGGGIAR